MTKTDKLTDLGAQYARLEELAAEVQHHYEEDDAVPDVGLSIADIEAKAPEGAPEPYLPGLSFVLRRERREASGTVDVYADGSIEIDDEPHPEELVDGEQVWRLLVETMNEKGEA